MTKYLRSMLVFGAAFLCVWALPARQATDISGVPVVVNEPYSATEETEITQRLPNGTQIDRKTTTKVWRDSQGRMRSEHYLTPLSTRGGAEILVSIMIRDPLAGFEYLLNPREHNGEQFPLHPMRKETAASARLSRTAEGAGISANATPNAPDPNVTRENLGTQMMDGLSVDGIRTVHTVPAETVGNHEPYQIVTERWYSKELRISLEVKVTDPRAGDRTMQVTELIVPSLTLHCFSRRPITESRRTNN